MTKLKPDRPDGIMEHGAFSFETSKLYITALILLFHVLPLAFIFSGDVGKSLLNAYGMMILNPLFIVVTMIIYGIKIGFNFKMPLLCTVLSTVSVPMYYEFSNDISQGILYYPMVSTAIAFVLYIIFTFAAICIGAVLKKSIP